MALSPPMKISRHRMFFSSRRAGAAEFAWISERGSRLRRLTHIRCMPIREQRRFTKCYPAILVFQEAFGVNAHIRDVTERFAELGYLAAAPEVFHRSAPPGFEGNYSDFPSVQPHMKAMTNEGLEADIRATYELLRNDNACNGRFASIGFCMGGRVSYLANSILPLGA